MFSSALIKLIYHFPDSPLQEDSVPSFLTVIGGDKKNNEPTAFPHLFTVVRLVKEIE